MTVEFEAGGLDGSTRECWIIDSKLRTWRCERGVEGIELAVLHLALVGQIGIEALVLVTNTESNDVGCTKCHVVGAGVVVHRLGIKSHLVERGVVLVTVRYEVVADANSKGPKADSSAPEV